MHKMIYPFPNQDCLSTKNQDLSSLLGGKGANLLKISEIGIPTPPGFIISTEVCNYYNHHHTLPEIFYEYLNQAIDNLALRAGKNFESEINPLLVSVRSGAKISMPGMMDTILNLGMNDKVVQNLARTTHKAEFAYDCYRRFIQMFGEIILNINPSQFEEALQNIKNINKIESDSDLNLSQLQELIYIYKNIIKTSSGKDLPQCPFEQLKLAIIAVIKSWNSNRAQIYRKLYHIPNDLGTAVIIQSMVFGNFSESSATGVVFTRNPVNGVKEIFGEYLINAQGEDIVAGKYTPACLNIGPGSMANVMPQLYQELISYCAQLEEFYKDMQDIEFTIEHGKLYILQTRSGKRTSAAAVKIVHDLVAEGLISQEQALLSLDCKQLDQLLHPALNKPKNIKPIAKGLPASPGAAVGAIALCAETAEHLSKTQKVILVRLDTSPEDIKGMSCSAGILTARGGMTSHAAVVARGMGKPCITGINTLEVNESEGYILIKGHKIQAGEIITIDGTTGEIFTEVLDIKSSDFIQEYKTILEWADNYKELNVFANAETSQEMETALKFGASGIGLCRTEHMFFDTEKIKLIRQMILSISLDQRQMILNKLLPLHTKDFVDLLRLLNGKPINIRLLDPPLHEFLPREAKEITEVSEELNIDRSLIEYQLKRLHEVNPMLGHRGCRLGITHPDIYEMQVTAIFNAARQVLAEKTKVNLEIMLPLISITDEFIILKNLITITAEQLMADFGNVFEYKIGTMIELPRAVLIADKLAAHADYFSFGTNDLTQTTYGISRDDIASFYSEYKAEEIFKFDPFITLDQEGVGQLIDIANTKGKKVNPNLKTGICGEHGGDATSIEFCHKIGLDYVSCSPYRIPAARIAAAQAAIKNK